MSLTPPNHAQRLAEWLPAVWRERDASGDLAGLLAVYGDLLDAFRASLEQRLYDNFPDPDPDGRHCQDWLLPYFAQLLDVRLVSPDVDGRRAELRDAVAWRQRKGTRVSIEAIAEAVGQFEVEVQEGWQRVAITPRVDRPLLPATTFGEQAIDPDKGYGALAAHPGLPAASLDLRYCSRAVQCDANNPGAHTTTFLGNALAWRQIHRHGTPCAPDSFQDVSRRTVDLRTPDGRRGHAHPRRVLLYLPPADGFFAHQHTSMNWSSLDDVVAEALLAVQTDWVEGEEIVCRSGLIEFSIGRETWQGADWPVISLRALTPAPIRLRGIIRLDLPAIYGFENFWLDNRVEISHGAIRLVGCAARQLSVFTAERDRPVIDARACLFKRLEAARGLVRLEYATVLDSLLAERLQVSDSILLCDVRKDTIDDDVPAAGCLRYSRLQYLPLKPPDADPDWLSQGQRSALQVYAQTCTDAQPLFWSTQFGQPGCAVLHPDCPAIIQSGAEDGGEMGAYHQARYVLRQQAVLDKLQEFLPLGMEAVLIADPSLACPPPTVTQS